MKPYFQETAEQDQGGQRKNTKKTELKKEKTEMSKGTKVVSLILKVLVIVSAVSGVALSAAAGSAAFMGGTRVFMYFTVQSNILIALVCLIGAFLMGRDTVPHAWYVVKLVATVSITLTGVVFCFVLAPTLGDKAWNLQNILTHVAVPVLSVIDFFVTGVYSRLRIRDTFFVVIPPVLYAVYAGIGFLNGWDFGAGNNYPYFFLNWGSPAGAFGFIRDEPYIGTGWWIIGLLIFLILIALLYLGILSLLKKAGKKGGKNNYA